ncbi:MAG TPA: acyltransferase, partial [Acetobacteraceae bacterium]|nr:acyltransferase [Acetobacteraceae bacterium]
MTTIPWHHRKERGSVALTRFMIWLALGGGSAIVRLLLYPITAYFFLRPGPARAASREYLRRALARPVTRIDRFRHIFVFASVLLDRVLLLANRCDSLHLDVTGLNNLTTALAAGRGCILLGSHLGSFDVLRAFGRGSPVPVRALMHRDNQGACSRLLEQLDPALQDHIIQTGTGESMLRVREALARGEIVGVLADRAQPGGRAGRKSLAVPFLGQPATFPTGPFLLIRHLDAP